MNIHNGHMISVLFFFPSFWHLEYWSFLIKELIDLLKTTLDPHFEGPHFQGLVWKLSLEQFMHLVKDKHIYVYCKILELQIYL